MPPPARTESRSRPRARVIAVRLAIVLAIELLLFGVSWWTLFSPSAQWPTAVAIAGAVLFAGAIVALPVLMVAGHGRRHLDRAAVAGDVLLGASWVLFSCSVVGQLAGAALAIAGVDDPARSRIVAVAVGLVAAVALAWGHFEAMRVPRLRHLDVTLRRLGAGLDGLRVVLITDTHYGPLDRSRWSASVVERVNELDADIVCHVGDIADGAPEVREPQARPLADVRARLARVYVTGNHEYIGEAQGWVDYVADIGWDALRNTHRVVERGGHRLIVAGVDDATAKGSGEDGHGQDLGAALEGADPALPVLLLAHQPKQVRHAVAAGVDLQVSGHTHGGQIWPFGFLVRLDQPVVQGLSAHGDRTQLYTSRGTGFWGPPFRVFAPSEITVLTLRTS